MRALANDREITATLGVPVRRVEAAAWLGSGLVCGVAGLLLADLFTSLDYAALTFLVISSLAAALIGRLRSLWVTLAGGIAVGFAQAVLAPYDTDHQLPVGDALRPVHRGAAAGSRATASSRSRGPRNKLLSMGQPPGRDEARPTWFAPALEQGTLDRAPGSSPCSSRSSSGPSRT